MKILTAAALVSILAFTTTGLPRVGLSAGSGKILKGLDKGLQGVGVVTGIGGLLTDHGNSGDNNAPAAPVPTPVVPSSSTSAVPAPTQANEHAKRRGGYEGSSRVSGGVNGSVPCFGLITADLDIDAGRNCEAAPAPTESISAPIQSITLIKRRGGSSHVSEGVDSASNGINDTITDILGHGNATRSSTTLEVEADSIHGGGETVVNSRSLGKGRGGRTSSGNLDTANDTVHISNLSIDATKSNRDSLSKRGGGRISQAIVDTGSNAIDDGINVIDNAADANNES